MTYPSRPDISDTIFEAQPGGGGAPGGGRSRRRTGGIVSQGMSHSRYSQGPMPTRLSAPVRPGSPALPGSNGLIRRHCVSLNSYRLAAIHQVSAPSRTPMNHTLLPRGIPECRLALEGNQFEMNRTKLGLDGRDEDIAHLLPDGRDHGMRRHSASLLQFHCRHRLVPGALRTSLARRGRGSGFSQSQAGPMVNTPLSIALGRAGVAYLLLLHQETAPRRKRWHPHRASSR